MKTGVVLVAVVLTAAHGVADSTKTEVPSFGGDKSKSSPSVIEAKSDGTVFLNSQGLLEMKSDAFSVDRRLKATNHPTAVPRLLIPTSKTGYDLITTDFDSRLQADLRRVSEMPIKASPRL
jgi:hypothetical protein